MDMNRRQFLATSMAAGTAALLPQRPANSRRVDVHYHLWSPEFMNMAKANGFTVTPGAPLYWDPSKKPWSLSGAIEHNDKAGVIGMTSVPGTTNWGPKAELWARLARVSNDYAAKIRADYPRFFGMWATLPMRDIDGTLKEIAYALDTLKADGFGLITNYVVNGADRFLGDEMFNPIYEELNRRKAVVYVHPANLGCTPGPRGQVCGSVLPAGVPGSDYPINTGRAMATLVYTGSTTRFPDIRWIFSHGGGTTPSLFGRYVMHREAPDSLPSGASFKGTAYEFKKFYYDTAQVYTKEEMTLAKSLWSVSHLVFGSDYPYWSAIDTAEGLKNCGAFTAAELQAIDYGNIQQLVPRLRSVS